MTDLKEPNPCRIRRGIVTTHPDGFPKGYTGPHFAITCCARPKCVVKFLDYAKALTGLQAHYVEDKPK